MIIVQSRLFSLLWVGLIQLIEGLNKRKKLTLPQVSKDSLIPSTCVSVFPLGHWFFPAFGF